MERKLSPQRALLSRYVSQWSLRDLQDQLPDNELVALNNFAKRVLVVTHDIVAEHKIFVWHEGEHHLARIYDDSIRVSIHPSGVYEGVLGGLLNLGIHTRDGAEPTVNDDIAHHLLANFDCSVLGRRDLAPFLFKQPVRNVVWPTRGKETGTGRPLGDQWFSSIKCPWSVPLVELVS
jgi:hypothetical protein